MIFYICLSMDVDFYGRLVGKLSHFDVRNPAKQLILENIPFFMGFHRYEVVQDFFHQQ